MVTIKFYHIFWLVVGEKYKEDKFLFELDAVRWGEDLDNETSGTKENN